MKALRNPFVRFVAFVLIVGAGFIALRWGPLQSYLDLDRVSEVLEFLRQQPGSAALLVAVTAVLTVFGLPATLAVLTAGAVFGVLRGALLSFAGLYLGALGLGTLDRETLGRRARGRDRCSVAVRTSLLDHVAEASAGRRPDPSLAVADTFDHRGRDSQMVAKPRAAGRVIAPTAPVGGDPR
jgi:hypothetical protein